MPALELDDGDTAALFQLFLFLLIKLLVLINDDAGHAA